MMVFSVGDVVSRISDDEHVVCSVNQSGDLMLVRCIKPDCSGCFAVGDEEWNLPRRYTIVETSQSLTDL